MGSRIAPKTDTPKIPAPTRIVVVDDHVFMRELMTAALGRQDGSYEVVAAVGTAGAAIEACREFAPDLLILDIHLPDQSGIDAMPAIRSVSPNTHVLLCTALPSEDCIIQALRAGAKGFVEKTNSWDDFLTAVERVARGEQYFCSNSTGVTPLPATAPIAEPRLNARVLLSRREQEIIGLIARGSTSKEIASKLFISAATVETHRTNAMGKVGARNVASLVLYAFQSGLVEASSGFP
jgi:DNA-binding NarL/FixJ family response regulator